MAVEKSNEAVLTSCCVTCEVVCVVGCCLVPTVLVLSVVSAGIVVIVTVAG